MEHAGESKLKRELGLLHATMLGIGGAISAGVFVMLGRATSMAGPAIIVVLFVCGLINLLTMFSFCELGSALPIAGGEYSYVKTAYGGIMAFLTGWFEWISQMFFAALMSVGSALIISIFIPVNVQITAIVMVIIFTVINIRGVKETGTVGAILALTLLAILAAYMVGGLQHGFRVDAFQPFMPKGFFGVVGATAYIFIVYLGAEEIVVAQAEIKNPEKTIPRAILITAGVLIAIYCTIAYVTLGIIQPEALGELPAPLAFVAEKTMGPVGAILITVAGLLAALTSLNTAIMAQSRITYAMSRDGYFPRALSRVHERWRTPYVAVILGSILTLAFVSIGSLDFAGYGSDFGFIVGFSLVNLSLMKLRKAKPELKRPFKAPLYPLTPILGIGSSLLLLAFIDVRVLTLGAELSILALLAYYVIMMGYSRIRIAFGGINLGIGGLGMLLAYLIKSNLISLPGILAQWTNMLFYGLILVSVVYILAGVLNVTTKP